MESEKIKCILKHKIYENGTFRVVLLQTFSECVFTPDMQNVEIFKASGMLGEVISGIEYEIEGKWREYENKKTGNKEWTLDVRNIEEIIPESENGVIAYLQTLSGIGETLAKRIVGVIGVESVFNVLDNDIDKLKTVNGIGKGKFKKIVQSYNAKGKAKYLVEFLTSHGFSSKKAMKIFENFEEEQIDIVAEIKKNPYVLMNVKSIGFYSIDMLAKNMNFNMQSSQRLVAGILQTLYESEQGGKLFSYKAVTPGKMPQKYEDIIRFRYSELLTTGNTCISKDILYIKVCQLLEYIVSEFDFSRVFLNKDLCDKIVVYDHKDTGTSYVYRSTVYHAEQNIVRVLKMLNAKPKEVISDFEKLYEDVTWEKGIKLSAEQKQAIKLALENPVCVITGGPGTGKTSIQSILLKAFKKMRDKNNKSTNTVIVAPTGVAAKRISEKAEQEAYTIHSYFNVFSETEFDTFSNNSKFDSIDLLLIDEMSMVDNMLFSTVMRKISKRTKLILIGDVDQLESIGAGSVLRDIINSGIIPTAKLTQIYRQAEGSTISINAVRVNKGENQLVLDENFYFFEEEKSEKILESTLKLYKEFIKKHPVEKMMVLSPFKKLTVTGVNNLNEKLRAFANKNYQQKQRIHYQGNTYYKDDIVMFLKNTMNLANGDLGKITACYIKDDDKIIEAVFSGQKVKLIEDEISLLQLSYATTIHKSQGGEFPYIIMLIDPIHKTMIKKNLIYTGITRGKSKVILIGQKKVFDAGVSQKNTLTRKTLLAHFLVANTEVITKVGTKAPQIEFEQIAMQI